MRRVYAVLASLLVLAVVVQFYLAGVGAFARPQDDESFALHRITGMLVIPAFSLLATLAAALARAPGRLIGLTILPFGLVIVQTLIIVLGRALTGSTEDRTTAAGLAIIALHAMNGLLILGVAGYVARQARSLAGRRAGVEPTSVVTPAA